MRALLVRMPGAGRPSAEALFCGAIPEDNRIPFLWPLEQINTNLKQCTFITHSFIGQIQNGSV